MCFFLIASKVVASFSHLFLLYSWFQIGRHIILRLFLKTINLVPSVPGFWWDLPWVPCYYLVLIANPIRRILVRWTVLQRISRLCANVSTISCTGWQRLIGSPKLQIIFHKRATKYRSLLRKMTCKDKGSYESSPPCNMRHRERTKRESDVTTFLVWHDCFLAVVWHDCFWHCVTTTKYMTIFVFLSLFTTSAFMCVTGLIHIYESWLIHIYSYTHSHMYSYTHSHVSSYAHSYIYEWYSKEYM